MPRWEKADQWSTRAISPDGRANDSTFYASEASLAEAPPEDPDLERIDRRNATCTCSDTSLLEQSQNYDLVGYMEDDLLLSYPNFSQRFSIWIAAVMAVTLFYPTAANTFKDKVM